MKPGSKLTVRFIAYFVTFYLIITIGMFGSIFLFIMYLNERIGYEIQILDAFEIDMRMIETEDGYKIGEKLAILAKKNSGQLYYMNKSMEVLDFTGEDCSICDMSRNELLALDVQGMHVWKLDYGYLLFLQNSPTELLFTDLFNQWQTSGTISESSRLQLQERNISIDFYDKRWKRIDVIGEKRALVTMPDIVASNHDIVERKEHLQARTLEDGTTFVLRMPNEYYKPYEEPFNRGMILLLTLFVVFHLLLIVGTILLSLGISRRFVRPIVYLLARIEKLTHFHYQTTKDKRMHHEKTGQLKRKYKLFQPVDDSLTNLAERLEKNEQQIKRTEQLREEWITGLSHDLKTPLSSIYGYSAMLTSSYDWTPEEAQKFAQIIQDKATYMDALIQDLTYTYQLKNKAITPNFEQLHLTQWLQRFAVNRVTVQAQDNLYVQADERMLQRVVDNIVGNAKKHTPKGTAITITAYATKTDIVMTIADSGPGIPQNELDHLFNRYYRGTNTKDDTNGTGLGLAIAKQLIDLHNAHIHVTSTEQGTTFTIQLRRE